jgi:hypothetical protein
LHYKQVEGGAHDWNLNRGSTSSMLVCAKLDCFFNHRRITMTQNKSSGSQNKQSAHESEEEAAKRRAGQNPEKSSHDAKSRVKAGTGEGAGGGAKQKQKH